MPQFFIDQPTHSGQTVTLHGSDAKHIAQVLRLTKGDW
ncbi:MAG: 16S rRNA methyltransferase, partial [Deltaproteobacteria bacterium]|nr:16S rRNA methyltransferase [Deltaproteobacteria bacterium]